MFFFLSLILHHIFEKKETDYWWEEFGSSSKLTFVSLYGIPFVVLNEWMLSSSRTGLLQWTKWRVSSVLCHSSAVLKLPPLRRRSSGIVVCQRKHCSGLGFILFLFWLLNTSHNQIIYLVNINEFQYTVKWQLMSPRFELNTLRIRSIYLLVHLFNLI